MLGAVVGVIGAAVLAITGWAINLHSRVSVLETNYTTLTTLVETKLEAFTKLFDTKFTEIDRRLERIENKIDAR